MPTITKKPTKSVTQTACYHCGEPCEEPSTPSTVRTLSSNSTILSFCCEGCKMVYEILNANDLCQFYEIEKKAGISLKGKKMEQYAYLEEEKIVAQLINFSNEKISKATFHIPQIHCASCIWLLENLYKLNDGILASKVNFLKKEVYITFSNSVTTYRKIVELLASIGYAPVLLLGNLDTPKRKYVDKSFYYQLGIAGFAFGNIMLLSLPEYFGLKDSVFQKVFGYLNIILILPVVFYSGQDYLKSAWQGLQQQYLNIDVPISLGILTLFSRSVFEIMTHTGAGYLDSLAGLVFFLLIGKWFQKVTYHQLSFERDYKSYFPIAATVLKNDIETSVALSHLNIGDQILLRHGELIPTDGVLQKGIARIDYSFVTGESEPVHKEVGEKLFAGGRQTDGTIQLRVSKKLTQSYLTQLWNDATFQKTSESATSHLANQVGKYFTIVILAIAFITLGYWLPKDIPLAINAFTAVLIIACPCAIALSIPFTFGNAMRLLGRHGFYLKNTNVIEQLNAINTVVFDKTGTITNNSKSKVNYKGKSLSETEQLAVYALAKQSSHPISRQIVSFLLDNFQLANTLSNTEIIDFKERSGKGIQGFYKGLFIEVWKMNAQVGDALKVGPVLSKQGTILKIDGQQKGIFYSKNSYRRGLAFLLKKWYNHYKLFLLSGDNDQEKSFLERWFFKNHLFFQQSPKDKLAFIKNLQAKDGKVLMLGDGLNDAGALQQAEVGIVIAEDINNFTPACDAILDAKQFRHLPDFISYAQSSLKVVYAAYGLAFIYNVIGLSFAVQGALSPVIAAILMPLSSVTIVAFGVGMTYLLQPKTKSDV